MRVSLMLGNPSFRLAAVGAIGLILLALMSAFTIRNLLMAERITLARSVAESTRSIAQSYDVAVRAGRLSLAEAQERAKADIRAISYQGHHYVFVINTDGIMVVHGARPEYEGKDFLHEVDSDGVNFGPAFLARAREGGGSTYYRFPKPGVDEPVRKVSYTVLYEPWGWVFGTGVYLDDIEAVFWQVMRNFILFAGGVTVAVSVLAYYASEQLLAETTRRRRAEKEALRASKLVGIGQLASGIAHEINTPVQYLGDNLNYVEREIGRLLKALRRGSVPGEQEIAAFEDEVSSALRDGLDGVGTISRIVASLKAFCQPGSGEMTEMDVNGSVESTVTVCAHAWNPVARVECRLAPGLPTVLCRVGEVNQVFLSVILNAVEAIRAAGKPLPGHILVETFAKEAGVAVRVSDNGCGVPEKLRERIFDPFFTTKPVGQGTGQGLAVSRDIIEVKLGGTIEVGGTAGDGAVFTIWIPCRPPGKG